mmetsp:Transcript_26880/g.75547  ORF Transcript_26880/g.75547 Transcript_26880/m.75547 type:complete len:98 (-) Transcript_26880:137-430(-)
MVVMIWQTIVSSAFSTNAIRFNHFACFILFHLRFLFIHDETTLHHVVSATFQQKIWAALGTAVVSATGVLYFGESIDAVKISCLMMIIAGVIGLNMR